MRQARPSGGHTPSMIKALAGGNAIMGIRAYYQLTKDDEDIGEEISLDKSYTDLFIGLDAMGLDGNHIVLGPTSEEEEDAETQGDGYYASELSLAEVQANWDKIKDIQFDRFYAAFKTTDLGKSYADEIDKHYLQAYFSELKSLYQKAVLQGTGIRISAC